MRGRLYCSTSLVAGSGFDARQGLVGGTALRYHYQQTQTSYCNKYAGGVQKNLPGEYEEEERRYNICENEVFEGDCSEFEINFLPSLGSCFVTIS